jgi:hypothetical protein
MNQMTAPPRFLQGVQYLKFLERYHAVAEPRSYFEIGTNTGRSLRLARCPKVAVDPKFILKFDPIGASPSAHLFQITSDEFFKEYDLKAFLPQGVDFAFLDGLHLFEYLLRDFINTEKYSHENSVIILHDCYPINEEITERVWNTPGRKIQQTRDWWAGDVWKLLPILREYRPDLEMQVLDCPPTGLVVLRGLNRNSTVLQESYEKIISKFAAMTLHDYGLERLHAEFQLVESTPIFEQAAVQKTFVFAHVPGT